MRDSNPGPSALEADALITRPTRRFLEGAGKDSPESGALADCYRWAMLLIGQKGLSRKVKEGVGGPDDPHLEVSVTSKFSKGIPKRAGPSIP